MKRRTEAQWRTLFTEQANSGLTVEDFCKAQGLNSSYFSVRRKQLLSTDKANVTTGFVAVSMPGQGHVMMIELYLGDALQLRVPASVSPHWLAALIQHLRA